MPALSTRNRALPSTNPTAGAELGEMRSRGPRFSPAARTRWPAARRRPNSPPRPMPCRNRRTASRIGGRHADGGERRHAADRHRGQAHDQQRRDEACRLRPRRSPKWPNRIAPEWPGDEPDGETWPATAGFPAIGGERREEQLAEHQRRRGAVDVEVVELDRGADKNWRPRYDSGTALTQRYSWTAPFGWLLC